MLITVVKKVVRNAQEELTALTRPVTIVADCADATCSPLPGMCT